MVARGPDPSLFDQKVQKMSTLKLGTTNLPKFVAKKRSIFLDLPTLCEKAGLRPWIVGNFQGFDLQFLPRKVLTVIFVRISFPHSLNERYKLVNCVLLQSITFFSRLKNNDIFVVYFIKWYLGSKKGVHQRPCNWETSITNPFFKDFWMALMHALYPSMVRQMAKHLYPIYVKNCKTTLEHNGR